MALVANNDNDAYARDITSTPGHAIIVPLVWHWTDLE